MMAAMFYKETENVYRLKVPFEDLYTSVFLLQTKSGNALVDCATTGEDVEEYILPALKNAGVSAEDIRYIILTHSHGDHAGGKERLLRSMPNAEIVTTAQKRLMDGMTTIELKGHTLDCIGVLDETDGTLIAGDGLQGYGVGKYRCSLESKEEYLKTIGRIGSNKAIKNILFSHAYEPWNKDAAFGREEAEKCLQDCLNYVTGVKNESDSH